MEGNEISQSVETSVNSLLSSENLVTVGEIPILQSGNSIINPDGTITAAGNAILSVPVLKNGSFVGANSQEIVFNDSDETKTLLLYPNPLTVLTNGSSNIYNIDSTSGEVISVLSCGDDISKDKSNEQNVEILDSSAISLLEDRGKLPNSHLVSNIQPPIGKGPYKCNYCDASLQKWNLYQKHLKTHADDKPFRCKHCPSSFNRQINYDLHQAIHSPNDLSCPICSKSFTRRASLKAHLMLHEEDDNVCCPECSEEFTSQVQLNKHMKEHESVNEMLFCKVCKMEFDRMSSLKAHMKAHYKFKASLKNKSFKKRKLDRTTFIHTCEFCMKKFQKPSQLIRHKRIHTGERPFVCEICNKAFNQKASLQTHKVMHSGDRPYRCEFCDATFSQRGNLRSHVKRVHDISQNSNNVYGCFHCSCMFRKLGNLNAHISKMHSDKIVNGMTTSTIAQEIVDSEHDKENDGNRNVNDVINQLLELSKQMVDNNAEKTQMQIQRIAEEGQVSADILQQALENSGLPTTDQSKVLASTVDKVFKGDENRNEVRCKPVKRYTVRRGPGHNWHQCPYCAKEFKKPSDLVRHIRIHTHEKPYKCSECFRSFTVKSALTAHLRSHIGIKDFKCNVCNKLFAASGSLKIHMRLHTGVRPYSCHICNKTFRTTGHRKSHMLSHERPKRKTPIKKCKIEAQKELLKKDNIQLPDIPLQEPILITETGLVQQVPKTNPVYSQSSSNETTSNTDRPFVCKYCTRCFKKSSHLKQHVRSHTGERPFDCKQCSRSFVSNGVLKEHMKTHTGIKSFKCDLCDVKFSTNGSLKRHMCTHSDARPYMCPYCQKTFKTSNNCKKHMKIHKLELAVQAAQSGDASKQDDQSYIQPFEIEATADGDQSSVPIGTHQEFMLTSETLNQLQQTLGQHVYGENGEMSNVVTATLPTVDQSTLENLSQAVVHADITTENGETVHFNQHNEVQTNGDQTANGPFTISIPGLNAQFSIQNMNELTSELTSTTIASHNSIEGNVVSSIANHNAVESVQSTIPTQGNIVTVSSNENGSINALLKDNMIEKIDGVSEKNNMFQQEKTVTIADLNVSENCTVDLLSSVNHENVADGENLTDLVTEMESASYVAEKEQLKCSYCPKEFKKANQLKLHERSHTGEKPFKCDECGSCFVSHRILKNHQKTHSKSRNFTCKVCLMSFTTNGSLTRHMASHDKPPKCFTCNETFSSMDSLKEHIAEKHASIPKVTPQTDDVELQTNSRADEDLLANRAKPKKSRSRGNVIRLSDEQADEIAKQNPNDVSLLSEKILIASAAEKNYICEIKEKDDVPEEPKHPHKCCSCPKSFKKPSDLVRHIRIHTGEKPFICAICSRAFTVKSTLGIHMKTHTQEKDFHCHVCDCMFSTKGSLKIHMRLHTGSKPFKCPECGQRFRTSGHRKIHMQNHKKSESASKKHEAKKIDATTETFEIVATDEEVSTVSQVLDASSNEVILSTNQIIDPNNLLQQVGNSSAVIPNITLPADFLSTSDTQLVQQSGVDGVQFQVPSTVLVQQLHEPGTFNIAINNLLQFLSSSSDTSILNTASLVTSGNDTVESETVISHADGTQQVTIPVSSGLDGTFNSTFEVTEQTVDSSKKSEMETVQASSTGTIELAHVMLTSSSEDKKHVCMICDKSFKRPHSLKAHLKTHSESGGDVKKASHQCSHCEKVFSKPSQLSRHIRIHTGERPYTCEICNMSFNQTNALQSHWKKHTGEKPYECKFCSKVFSQKGNLTTHIKKTHSLEKMKESIEDVQSILNPTAEDGHSQSEANTTKSDIQEADISHNPDYLEGVVGELFPQ